MRLIIQPDYQSVSLWAAHYVAAKIKAANPTPEKPFVLGCPTGSSPLGMYKALIDLNKKGIVSFQNVVTFNMDEYVGLPKEHPESYYSFMWNNDFCARTYFALLVVFAINICFLRLIYDSVSANSFFRILYGITVLSVHTGQLKKDRFVFL